MIKVYFPPGCYGTYFTRCLSNYTNLRTGPFVEFKVDKFGSSHRHRADGYLRSLIIEGHIDMLTQEENDQIITILPCQGHFLDYYNNQFYKQKKGQLISFLLIQMSQSDAELKLKSQWGYDGKFDNTVPQWIMREWCSYWIHDVLNSSYDKLPYESLNSIAQVTTQDIFENFISVLENTATVLGLEINVDTDIINKQHEDFLTAQRFHNSQHRCINYVQDLLDNKNTAMTTHSIFDEAYIQHLLREQNLEIHCDGLNVFPTTTHELKSLTYENSNHNN